MKRTSVVMNKNSKPSQKEAEKPLNEQIQAKLNDKTPSTFKTLTFHQAYNEWFDNYKFISESKQSTIATKYYKVEHIKRNISRYTS
uniref:hypothetical protein n=1 Tax=Mammaliicoccus sciuri TaxID=1296 RepID=UPI00280BF01D|nr:hypothetical protein [Mammaliicoccus sciuri]